MVLLVRPRPWWKGFLYAVLPSISLTAGMALFGSVVYVLYWLGERYVLAG